MKRKLAAVVLALVLILALACPALAAGGSTGAVISPQTVLVDGTKTELEVYNIGGSNFFKLRDIAYVLSGTEAQYSVAYDNALQLVSVTKGGSYTPVGGELVKGADKSATAVLSEQRLTVDGEETGITAYNIGGNNFFKLRELGAALGFYVDYDYQTNVVSIDSRYVLDEVLRIVTNAEFEPYSYYEKDGNLAGIDIEVICAAASRLGMTPEITDEEFDAVLNGVQVGKYDVAIAGITETEYRLERAYATVPYFSENDVIIVPTDSAITMPDQLYTRGNRIGVLSGTVADNYVTWDADDSTSSGVAVSVVRYDSSAAALAAVKKGDVEALVINETQTGTIGDGLKALSDYYCQEDYVVYVGKNDTTLYNMINKTIQDMLKDGTIDRIAARYISVK